MAGTYPDVPGPRIAYDREGAFCQRNIDGGIATLTSNEIRRMNNETWVTVGNTFLTDSSFYGIIFPTAKDLVGLFAQTNYGTVAPDTRRIETSSDATAINNGTWTTAVADVGLQQATSPAYRTGIYSVGTTGVVGVRLYMNRGAGFGVYTTDPPTIHVYGTTPDALIPSRLKLWHPTLDTNVGGAYFDWGDVAQGTLATRQFRVKNSSATQTASNVTVTIEALTDPAPPIAAMHTFSLDGVNYASNLNFASLAPGAISSVITMKRNIAVNAVIGAAAQRIIAIAGGFA